MLLHYVVSNYKSIGHPVEFKLQQINVSSSHCLQKMIRGRYFAEAVFLDQMHPENLLSLNPSLLRVILSLEAKKVEKESELINSEETWRN